METFFFFYLHKQNKMLFSFFGFVCSIVCHILSVDKVKLIIWLVTFCMVKKCGMCCYVVLFCLCVMDMCVNDKQNGFEHRDTFVILGSRMLTRLKVMWIFVLVEIYLGDIHRVLNGMNSIGERVV